MKIIYADSLFFLNLLTDYLICLVSARACGVCLKRWRYLLGGVVGGIYAVVVYLPQMAFFAHPLMKLCTAVLISMVAFGGEEKPLRCTAVFLAISAAFGGAVWAVSMASCVGGESPAVTLPINGKTLLFAFAVCYALLSLVFRKRVKLLSRGRVKVEIEHMGRQVEFMALRDSGNSLCDPISGADIMIVSPHALKGIFRENTEIFSLSAVEAVELSEKLPELAGRLRLIPYSALGGGGLLPAFMPERVKVEGKVKKELLIAVSLDARGDGFEAIL